MPFTVFHWGFPLLLLQLLHRGNNNRKMQFHLVIIVSIPDVEGFLSLVIGLNTIRTHGPLHSIIGLMSIGVIYWYLLILVYQFLERCDKLKAYSKILLIQPMSKIETILLIFSPLFFHLGLDIFMHPDIQIWWPFNDNLNSLPTSQTARNSYNFGFYSLIMFIITILIPSKDQINLDS